MGGVRGALPQHPWRVPRPRARQGRAQDANARGCKGGIRARRAGQALEIGRGEL